MVQYKRPVVLVADDDSGIHALLRDLVTEEVPGAVYRGFPNAEEALGGYCHEPAQVGLVITDMRMPNPMDGVRLLSSLRERGYDGPAITMSAECSDEERKAAQTPHAEWVDKPFAIGDMADRIQRLLGPPRA